MKTLLGSAPYVNLNFLLSFTAVLAISKPWCGVSSTDANTQATVTCCAGVLCSTMTVLSLLYPPIRSCLVSLLELRECGLTRSWHTAKQCACFLYHASILCVETEQCITVYAFCILPAFLCQLSNEYQYTLLAVFVGNAVARCCHTSRRSLLTASPYV